VLPGYSIPELVSTAHSWARRFLSDWHQDRCDHESPSTSACIHAVLARNCWPRCSCRSPSRRGRHGDPDSNGHVRFRCGVNTGWFLSRGNQGAAAIGATHWTGQRLKRACDLHTRVAAFGRSETLSARKVADVRIAQQQTFGDSIAERSTRRCFNCGRLTPTSSYSKPCD